MRESSLEANKYMDDSGKRLTHSQRIMEYLRWISHIPMSEESDRGRTAGEIAYSLGLSRDSVSKRLSELWNEKMIYRTDGRKCIIHDMKMDLWYFKVPEGKELVEPKGLTVYVDGENLIVKDYRTEKRVPMDLVMGAINNSSYGSINP